MALPVNFLMVLVFAVCGNFCEKRQTPKTGNADKCIDDAGNKRCLTAENCRNKVEAKKTDEQPVQSADDDEC